MKKTDFLETDFLCAAAISYPSFNSSAPMILSGNASLGGSMLLINDNLPNLYGYAAHSTPVQLTTLVGTTCVGASFSVAFSFYISVPDSSFGVKHGFVFALTRELTGSGRAGNNMGWGYTNSDGTVSKPSQNGSLAAEFDTFMDGPPINDVSPNHVGINLNYNMISVAAASTFITFASQRTVWAWIDYDATLSGGSSMMSVYINTQAVKPVTPSLNYALDLCSVFNGAGANLYPGFGSGTGMYDGYFRIPIPHCLT